MSKLPSPCQKCWNLPAKVNYKDKEYCTWHCAKKGNK